MTLAVIGTLVAESLTTDAVIELGLTLRRLHRIAIADPAPDQPCVWTLIDFTCADTDVEEFARQLARGMRIGPWYCDFATTTTKYVVLAGKIFTYARGSAAGYTEAAEYARGMGVPEAQLDWPA
jgi:hypothetical protein